METEELTAELTIPLLLLFHCLSLMTPQVGTLFDPYLFNNALALRMRAARA